MIDARLDGTRSSHRWREAPGNWDRLNCQAIYPSDNQWGIPELPAANWTPARLVAYNARRACESAEPDSAVHFFLDDYRFETIWTKPRRALSRLSRVGSALTPDFSLWRDMPLAMQLWQVYRARWCGAWMAEHGIRVIPTVGWSTAESYPFAFAGLEPGGVVAVSGVGVRGDAVPYFLAGFASMVRRLEPSTVLFYGHALTEQVSNLWGGPLEIYPTRWGC